MSTLVDKSRPQVRRPGSRGEEGVEVREEEAEKKMKMAQAWKLEGRAVVRQSCVTCLPAELKEIWGQICSASCRRVENVSRCSSSRVISTPSAEQTAALLSTQLLLLPLTLMFLLLLLLLQLLFLLVLPLQI